MELNHWASMLWSAGRKACLAGLGLIHYSGYVTLPEVEKIENSYRQDVNLVLSKPFLSA